MASWLQLPWEVIERIMGHCGDHPQTLHNFSLTCHNLRPRALCLLVVDISFQHGVEIFDFCDFLQANPHLKPFVRSIAVNPAHFAPFPLLSILPNLSELRFAPTYCQPLKPWETTGVMLLNRSSLTCCKHLGMQIQTLHLSKLSFPTYLDFSRVLLTFPNLTDLVCFSVVIEAEGNQAHLNLLKRRLFERLHLLTVNINYSYDMMDDIGDEASVAALLLDSEQELVQNTVETLTVHPYRSNGLSHPFNWPQLRSLVLKLHNSSLARAAMVFLKDFPPSTLKEVIVDFQPSALIHDIIEDFNIRHPDDEGLWEELEQSLLRFSQPRMVLHPDVLRNGRISFWTEEIGKHFPTLLQRGAFIVTPETVLPGTAGHDEKVLDLATSPDGKWVATASDDSTVILWNAADGAIARQWIAHNYHAVLSLAFSPDSQYLVSGGGRDDSNVNIWDLTEGSRQVTTLKGHTAGVTCCAWSPCDDIIASGSYDGTIRLWDARTFHELRVLEQAKLTFIYRIAFSPDGHWLISRTRGPHNGYYHCIWNVASGTLHNFKLPPDSEDGVERRDSVAVFDPGSTRVLVVERDVVKLVDIESGDELAVLRGTNETTDVAFSPDGTLVSAGSRDGMVELVDTETGDELAVLIGTDEIMDAAFSPDGTLVSTGSNGGMVKLWDADTGVELASPEGHGGEKVFQVRFSPCGRYVASASLDGTVRLWRTRDGSCVATLTSESDGSLESELGGDVMVEHVAFSPDGETLWSGDSDGTVSMRRMRDIIPTDEPEL